MAPKILITEKKPFQLESVLKDIEVNASDYYHGRRSFKLHYLNEASSTLSSMLNFEVAEPYVDPVFFIENALTDTQTLTPIEFLKSINESITSYRVQSDYVFHILASISVSNKHLKPFIHENGILRFRHSLPPLFKRRKITVDKEYASFIWVTVKAKDCDEAHRKAKELIIDQRAIWAVHMNSAIGRTYREDQRGSLNAIKINTQTVHDEKGNILKVGMVTPVETLRNRRFSPGQLEQFRKFELALASCKYADKLRKSLRMYVTGFDDVNDIRTFLTLWTAIENLASPDIANYDTVIRRCLFILKNAPRHRQILEHLRMRRNNLMHRAISNNDEYILVQQTQFYLRSLISFHVAHASTFRNLEHANKCLDLPTDVPLIKVGLSLLAG